MNKKQLSEHIGNIDDRLVQQAEQIPNYMVVRRQKRFRRFLTAAAALVLMVASFSVGAIAFAREIIVEVPAEQETLELEGINLTLILPDSWKGQYSAEKNGENFVVYNPQIKEAVSSGTELYDGGVLFTIVCYEESMTEKQFIENGLDFTAYRYLLATSGKTYILQYASDVQYDPADKEQERIYQKMMSEIEDIQFVVNNVFESITDSAVSKGIVKPGMQADDGKSLVWEGMSEREIDGTACYAFELRYSEDESINGEMAGRLLGIYAVSKDGTKFYQYNMADDMWE